MCYSLSPAVRSCEVMDAGKERQLEAEELEGVVETMLNSVAFAGAPMRRNLFQLLWQNRHKEERTSGKEIWMKLWPNEDHRKYDQQTGVREGAGVRRQHPRENVRHQCYALSKALNDYFNKGKPGGGWDTTSPWVIALKPGGPEHGYQLTWKKWNDPRSLTGAFWGPHLDSRQPISLVHVEHRFFLDEPKGLVFRYYDCNEEENRSALTELLERHPEHPEIDKAIAKHELIPLHPYVARGEIGGRDLIVKWFKDAAFEEIQYAGVRDLGPNSDAWKHSLILFGSAASNRFVSRMEERYAALPIRRASRTEFKIDSVSPAEADWLQAAHSEGECGVTMAGGEGAGCTLEFDPRTKIAPVLLTRVPNPDNAHAPVTIFNSERGKAIEKIAAVLTDDERMNREVQLHSVSQLQPPFPAAFQVLFAVSMRSLNFQICPLVWRSLKGKALLPRMSTSGMPRRS